MPLSVIVIDHAVVWNHWCVRAEPLCVCLRQDIGVVLSLCQSLVVFEQESLLSFRSFLVTNYALALLL